MSKLKSTTLLQNLYRTYHAFFLYLSPLRDINVSMSDLENTGQGQEGQYYNICSDAII